MSEWRLVRVPARGRGALPKNGVLGVRDLLRAVARTGSHPGEPVFPSPDFVLSRQFRRLGELAFATSAGRAALEDYLLMRKPESVRRPAAPAVSDCRSRGIRPCSLRPRPQPLCAATHRWSGRCRLRFGSLPERTRHAALVEFAGDAGTAASGDALGEDPAHGRRRAEVGRELLHSASPPRVRPVRVGTVVDQLVAVRRATAGVAAPARSPGCASPPSPGTAPAPPPAAMARRARSSAPGASAAEPQTADHDRIRLPAGGPLSRRSR